MNSARGIKKSWQDHCTHSLTHSLTHKIFLIVAILFSLTGCIAKNNVEVTLKNPKKATTQSLNITVSNVQVINHQIVITGTNLTAVNNFNIKEGSAITALQIESQTSTSIVANTLTNVSFAAGKIFDFVFSSAQAATTFTVNFSLCDSSLGGKGFNCAITPNDKEVLSYDAVSEKWKPKAVNGLSYQGAWDATAAQPVTSTEGDYFIVSVANAPFQVGDWIIFNGTTFDRIDNSQMIVNVFGRTGAVTALEGDYNLTKLSDVTITAPATNQVLTYNGTIWVNGAATYTETDPNVSAFAKAVLPTCGAGQVLKGDGTSLSCVTDNAGIFLTDVMNSLLTGLSVATNSAIVAGDNLLAALGKLQAQITSVASTYVAKAGGSTLAGTTTLTGTISLSTGLGRITVIDAPSLATDVVNKSYADLKLALTGGTMTGPLINNTSSASTAVAVTQAGTGYAATFMGGNVGIGTTNPATKLDVSGEVRIGNSSTACSGTNEGAQRYNSGTKIMEFCNGTVWTSFTAAVPVNPVGTVLPFACSSTPSGYLPCDGAVISRATYSALFAEIGITYGAGDGSTTFNVPDLRGRVAIDFFKIDAT